MPLSSRLFLRSNLLLTSKYHKFISKDLKKSLDFFESNILHLFNSSNASKCQSYIAHENPI